LGGHHCPVLAAPGLLNMQKQRKHERGQAMVEFAIVLPILIVMTLGGIYLTLSYMQKLRMNGLAFMSARVAVVRADGFDASGFVKEQYKRASQQNWVDKLRETPSIPQAKTAQVTLVKPAERLDILANALDILAGGGSSDPAELTARATQPREYWTYGTEARPRTRTIVDYRYGSVGNLPWLDLLDVIPKAIFDTTQMADTPPGGSGNDELLGLTPPNQNLLQFYADRGWSKSDYLANSEKENGQFNRMRLIGENFKAIQNGASLVGYLAEFSGFGAALKAVLGEVTETMSVTVETTMSKVSDTLDKQTRASVKDGILP